MNASFLAKLYGYARWRIRGAKFQIKGKTHEDYVHEAIKRVMEGPRNIPDWVNDADTALNFMTSVVSSLISNDFSSKEVETPAIPIEETVEPSVPSQADERLIASQEQEEAAIIMNKLREALKGKDNALLCLNAHSEIDVAEVGGQINKLLTAKTKLTLEQVIAAKKQILRTLEKIKDGNK